MAREYKIKSNKINFYVNSFVECLGVSFVLADFNLNEERTNGLYLKQIKHYFSIYKNHNFIKKIKILLENPCFKYDAPLEMALNMYYKKDPTHELLARAGLNIEQYNALYYEFIDFMKTINFNHFFSKNKNYYLNNLRQFSNDIKKYFPHKYLFDFLGMDSKNLNILLMFSITTANYGITVGKQLFCCIRPYKDTRFDQEIDFCSNLPYTTTLILHEFAHSFINPITKTFNEEISKIDKKCFEIAFKNNPYGEHKETVINETIIRAIECRYLKRYFNESYIEIKEDYIKDGFVFIPQIENLFDKYSSNRLLYKNIKMFYPFIIKIFK